MDFEMISRALSLDLYRMKKEMIRPIDRAEAAALREKFGIVDG